MIKYYLIQLSPPVSRVFSEPGVKKIIDSINGNRITFLIFELSYPNKPHIREISGWCSISLMNSFLLIYVKPYSFLIEDYEMIRRGGGLGTDYFLNEVGIKRDENIFYTPIMSEIIPGEIGIVQEDTLDSIKLKLVLFFSRV